MHELLYSIMHWQRASLQPSPILQSEREADEEGEAITLDKHWEPWDPGMLASIIEATLRRANCFDKVTKT